MNVLSACLVVAEDLRKVGFKEPCRHVHIEELLGLAMRVAQDARVTSHPAEGRN